MIDGFLLAILNMFEELGVITARELGVLYLRIRGLTLVEVATHYQCNVEQIRQIEAKARRKVLKAIDKAGARQPRTR